MTDHKEADGWTQIAADYEVRLTAVEAQRDALVKALEAIKACAICGYTLKGNEIFEQLAGLISKFNSELQKRVKIAEQALSAVGDAR